jgi:hypothetical protein
MRTNWQSKAPNGLKSRKQGFLFFGNFIQEKCNGSFNSN